MRTRLNGHGVLGFGLARATLALGLAAALGVSAQVVGLASPGKGLGNPKLTCGLESVPARLAAAKAVKGGLGGGAAALDDATAALLPLRGDYVAIDAVAVDDVQSLRAGLVALGLRGAAVSGRMVSGLLPLASVAQAGNLKSLKFARPAYCATNTGAVTSQGDPAQWSDSARILFGVDGTGITVGVLSDSFNNLGGAAADVASGDLPVGYTVLADLPGVSGIDEGRAMMQIVHDVAPGAALQFHTAFVGQADFAQGIKDLADNGCDVIVDDVFYFAEAMFQDDNVAQATDYAKALGVAYFSSAGNQARQSYESPYRESATLFDFDPGAGVDALLNVTIPTGTVYFVLQWDDPYFAISGAPGAATDLDIEIYHAGGPTGVGSADFNIGRDPVEVFGVIVSGGSLPLQIRINRWGGPLPGRVKLVWYGDMTVNEFATNSSTLCGHANAAGAEAVGAARYDATPVWGVIPPVLEYFSSAGGTPILFDTAGTRLAVPLLRTKPGIVAPDGGNNTFFGGDYEPDGWPNFFGTSASAPHAAGVAALMLDANGTLLPDAINGILRSTAWNMDVPGFDEDTGYGLIQSDFAVYAALPKPDLVVPVLDHASASLVARYLSAGQVYVRCQQANQGQVASRSCVVRFWLSTDATLSKGTDRFLAVGAVRSLAPGQKTALANTLLRLGRRLAPAETVYIIAEVDSEGVVAETSEANNTTVLKVVGI